MKIKVAKHRTSIDNYHYQCEENWEIRKQLISDCMKGKISQEEMRKKSKKAKYLFSAYEVENHPEKFEIIS